MTSNDFSFDVKSSFGFPSLFKKDDKGNDMYNILNLNLSPIVFTIFIIILIIFYVIFKSFGNENGDSSSLKGFSILFLVIWCIFIVLIFGNGLKYFFDLNVKTFMKDLLKPIPKLNFSLNSDKGEKYEDDDDDECGYESDTDGKEVYHIPRNIYTFENAKAMCKAFDSRLARINEVEDAYENGAEWCSYGWSADQMALFPTQLKSWKKYKKIKGHENDCGRPGINGGYIANPNVKYGINCFGIKPKQTKIEKELMKFDNELPTTENENIFNKKVKYYKERLPSILVSSFNKKKWSKV